MKKFLPILLALAAILISSSAFAANPFPVCPDTDGDGYAVCDATCTISGTKLKCGDCDPNHANINPGAPEIWEDGIDNDCKDDVPGQKNPDGSLANGDRRSMGSVIVARFSKGLGRSVTPRSSSELRLLKDIMVCSAAGTNCVVDYVGGKLNPAAGYRLLDKDCDGVLNVVADSYSPTLADQDKCRKAHPASACSTCPGASAPAVRRVALRPRTAPAVAPLPGTATSADSTASAPKASAKGARGGIDYSAPIAAAQATADAANKLATEASAKVNTFDAALAGHTEHLTALDTAIAEQKTAIANEEARAKAAEAAIDTKAQAAIDRSTEAVAAATYANEKVIELSSQGGFVEVYVGGGFIAQRDFDVTPVGKTKSIVVRENVAGVAELGANIGFESQSARYGIFGSFTENWDAGDSSMGGTAGGEVTWRLGGSQSYLGVHGIYRRHNAGGNVIYTNAVGDAFGGGLTYLVRGADQTHVGLQARLTAAWEDFGTDLGTVASRKAVQNGPVVSLMIDVLAGFSQASK